MIEITFPWPPKELSPNARLHWGAKSRATKQYRADAYYVTKLHDDFKSLKKLKGFRIHLAFHPPDRRHYDDDNLIRRFKAGRDGMASALGVDDKFIKIGSVDILDKIKGGAVVVTVTPT